MLGKLLSRALTSGSKNTFAPLLRSHFGADPQTFPVVSEGFNPVEQPNLHLAIEELLKQSGREHTLHGIAGASFIRELLRKAALFAAKRMPMAGPCARTSTRPCGNWSCTAAP